GGAEGSGGGGGEEEGERGGGGPREAGGRGGVSLGFGRQGIGAFGDGIERAPRRGVHHEERHEGHGQQRRHQPQDPACGVDEHLRPLYNTSPGNLGKRGSSCGSEWRWRRRRGRTSSAWGGGGWVNSSATPAPSSRPSPTPMPSARPRGRSCPGR